jgi:hypothetical protein
MSQELIDRWAAFIAKVDGRLDAIITEAGPGVLGIGRAHPDDQLPLGNAITGLDHRVRQLWDKLESTWESGVEPKFSAIGGAVFDRGIDMKEDARLTHDEKWANAKASWMTTLAEEALPRALAAEKEPVHCTNCGKPLALATRRKTVSHPCSACGTVNQVVPPPAVRYYFGFCVQNLAEAAALPKQQATARFRLEVDRNSRASGWAAESLESLERWRDMERAAFQAYADRRAELTGEPVDQDYVESRMRQFMKYGHDMNQAWVAKHGKQALG